jgi:hypothetical protein
MMSWIGRPRQVDSSAETCTLTQIIRSNWSDAAGSSSSSSPLWHCYHQLASQLANAPIPGGRAGDAACIIPAMQRQRLSSSAYDMWTLYTFQSICQQCCVHNVVLDVICTMYDTTWGQNEPPNERRLASWDTGRTTFIEQTSSLNELVLSPDKWY